MTLVESIAGRDGGLSESRNPGRADSSHAHD